MAFPARKHRCSVRDGVSLAAVQDVLGHQRLSTTQVYLGVAEEDLRAAIALLDLRGPP